MDVSHTHKYIHTLWAVGDTHSDFIHTYLGVQTLRFTFVWMLHPLNQRVYTFAQLSDTQVLQILIWTSFTLRCSSCSQRGWPHSLTCHALWAVEFLFRCAQQIAGISLSCCSPPLTYHSSRGSTRMPICFPSALLTIPMLKEIQGKT